MTFREAFRALFPNWRKPHGHLDPAEREGRWVCETADAKLKRISKTAR